MNWFVIRENEHVGPFDEVGLEELHRSGELSEQALVWREGMSEPVKYIDIKSFEEDDELPPELPPEVLSLNIQSPPSAPSGTPPSVPQAPPPLPANEVKVDEELEPELELSEEFLIEEDVAFEPKKLKKATGNRLVILVALIAIIAAGAFAWFYFQSRAASFARPAKMGVTDHQRLIGAASTSAKAPQFAFALAKDKSALWVSTNQPLRGPLKLKISSIPGRGLSETKVVATSQGFLEDSIAAFDSFDFENGQRIIDGWYTVELTSPIELDPEFPATIFGVKNRKISYRGQVLVSVMPEARFEKTLKEFKEMRRRNAANFWEELWQKYETTKAITLRIRKALNAVFEKSPRRWRKNVAEFEKEYTSNYGNFFTSFVIQNEKSYEELSNKDFPDKNEVIAGYTRLTRIAKSIGKETVGALEDMKNFKSARSKKAREAFRQDVLGRFDSLVKEMDAKISEMKAKVY